MKDPKVDACLYLLTGLLQRMDKENPGLIKNMIEGVKSDQAAIPKNTTEKEHVSEICKEALVLLERAQLYLEEENNA